MGSKRIGILIEMHPHGFCMEPSRPGDPEIRARLQRHLRRRNSFRRCGFSGAFSLSWLNIKPEVLVFDSIYLGGSPLSRSVFEVFRA